MNYTVKLDISKIAGAFACNIKGKTSMKQCICIPTDANGVFVGQKGIYIDLRVSELAEDRQKFDDTHVVRQSFPKGVFEKMTDEQKKNIPLLGGMKPVQQSSNKALDNAPEVVADGDELPY